MINWNEVKVGGTIIHKVGSPRKVLGVYDTWVWLNDAEGEPLTYNKDELTDWTIYYQWEDVSEECEFDDHMHVLHNGIYIGHEMVDGGWYRRGPGLRVWKRKDGDVNG